MDYPALRELQREEGENKDGDGYHVPYKCSMGFWTAGYGRNLEKARFTDSEVERWLREDYERAVTQAEKIPEYAALSKNRKRVVAQMVYQMGYRGVMNFRNMRAAFRHNDFKLAGAEMLRSQWANQTPARAKRLASRMVLDTWPE